MWGMGDLVIATPFLQAVSQKYNVTLLAKPYAFDLQRRFWPEVRVMPFIAPWTAFRGKYRLFEWPWRELFRLRRLAAERMEIGLSARWDPRDHFLLKALRVRRRLGPHRCRTAGSSLAARSVRATDPTRPPGRLSSASRLRSRSAEFLARVRGKRCGDTAHGVGTAFAN